jgi:hypothetical protein
MASWRAELTGVSQHSSEDKQKGGRRHPRRGFVGQRECQEVASSMKGGSGALGIAAHQRGRIRRRHDAGEHRQARRPELSSTSSSTLQGSCAIKPVKIEKEFRDKV